MLQETQKINMQFKKPKRISEFSAFFLNSFTSIVILILALKKNLSPLFFGFFILLHILIIYLTKLSEFSPIPVLHYLRPFQGILIILPFISAFGYYFTYLIGGMSDLSQIKAQYCTLFSYLMGFWSILASFSLIGVYFAIMTIVRWFPYFVNIAPTFETPFILYILSIFFALIGLGGWITFNHAIFISLWEKQDFGEQKAKFKQLAYIFLGFSLVFSISGVYLEQMLWEIAINIPLV